MGRRGADRPLIEAAGELAETFAPAPDACVLAWEGGETPLLVWAGGRTASILQLEPAALVGKPVGPLFMGGERTARDLGAACAASPVAEQRPMLRGGQSFPAQLLLRGIDGGVLALVRDLTRAQTDADAALRSEDLARFASLVAHEVRNPLSAVKIALQTLQRHGTLAANDQKRTSIALREVLNIELLLNEVLEFARPPSLSFVPGDIRAPIEEAIAGVEAEWDGRGVVFERALPERLRPALLDPVRVRTAVKILCRQAAMAAEEAGGGAVRVAVREREGGWELEVADSGRTLPAELRERAFTPFTPQRARGSGLGLAVVARIAGEHRGEARLAERPGGGNVITVTFSA